MFDRDIQAPELLPTLPRKFFFKLLCNGRWSNWTFVESKSRPWNREVVDDDGAYILELDHDPKSILGPVRKCPRLPPPMKDFEAQTVDSTAQYKLVEGTRYR